MARPRVGQHAGHPPVARAVAAAAAAVREHDRPGRLRARGDGQVPGQGEAGPDGDHHPRGRRRRVVVGRGRLRRARGEQRQHLAVVRGPEGLVPLADGAQVAWLQHAHHVVGLGLQRRHALRRAHRHGQDQPPRSPRADRAQRRPRRPPGRQAVVHDDDGAPGDVERRPPAAVALHTLVELAVRVAHRRLELAVAGQRPSHGESVEDLDAALRDGADAVLGVPGGADLAYDEDVERRTQRARHLGGDGDAAPGQAEHDRVLRRVGRQALGERPARGMAIGVGAGWGARGQGPSGAGSTRRPSGWRRSRPWLVGGRSRSSLSILATLWA